MSLLIIVGCIWGICKLISAASAASKERARQAEMARVRAAQERQRAEQARMREEWKAAQAAEREKPDQVKIAYNMGYLDAIKNIRYIVSVVWEEEK